MFAQPSAHRFAQVSVFVELFREMLQQRYGRALLRALSALRPNPSGGAGKSVGTGPVAVLVAGPAPAAVGPVAVVPPLTNGLQTAEAEAAPVEAAAEGAASEAAAVEADISPGATTENLPDAATDDGQDPGTTAAATSPIKANGSPTVVAAVAVATKLELPDHKMDAVEADIAGANGASPVTKQTCDGAGSGKRRLSAGDDGGDEVEAASGGQAEMRSSPLHAKRPRLEQQSAGADVAGCL